MKEKMLAVACAVSILASAAALAATAAGRARAAEPAKGDFPLKTVSENNDTRVSAFRSEGVLCFVASTRGGSGISLQCQHP